MIVCENRALFESALGIVAKEPGSTRRYEAQKRPNLQLIFCHHILYCSFVTSPYARVCADCADDYSWSGSN